MQSEKPGKALLAGDEFSKIPDVLPVLPVRDTVALPGIPVSLLVRRARSLEALKMAVHNTSTYLLVARQRDPRTENPTLEDLAPVACVVRITQLITTQNLNQEICQAQMVGLLRARIGAARGDADEALQVEVELCPEDETPSAESAAARARVIELAKRLIDLRDDLLAEQKDQLEKLPTASLLADTFAVHMPMSNEDRIELLCETDSTRRLWKLVTVLEREITIAREYNLLRRQDAEEEVVDPRQRERLLRRRMREIQKELHESDAGEHEVDELAERLGALELPEEARSHVDRELRRFRALPSHASDRHLQRTWLEWVADLPWSEETEDQLDIKATRAVLDEDHHDLDKVKERILEYLSVRKLAPDVRAPILCFAGPPGVGKTSLGRSIARAMGRRFARVSLGGVRDEAEIRGHRRTYVGALPGRILQSLCRVGARNPVFLLDEVDKIGADALHGDASSALLEVLDPEQNSRFSDHYLEIPFNLSKVLFIATANTLGAIAPALLDRMDVIELPGYSDHDKRIIARRHLIPKQLADHGLEAGQLRVDDATIERVVHEYTREAGVRNLDRLFATLMRKVAAHIVANPDCAPLQVDADFARQALGPPPHLPEVAERSTLPGVVVGLASTANGGDILFIEALAAPGGKGVRLRLTGQLGEVMRESAEAALSWVRANAATLAPGAPVLEAGELHLHVPAGAIPKDGPSAGIAMATALVSVLSGRRARGEVAMTGELSLRGLVLPVGGIKEKVLAAARAGIKRVLIPRRNQKDLVEIPTEILDQVEIVPIETVEEAIGAALESN